MADEELESIELQYLREKALRSTQKQRRRGQQPPQDQYLGSNFDSFSRHKNPSDIAPQEALPNSRKRGPPSRSLKVTAKHPRRASSASSSRSGSYSTTSSHTRSRSHSSYSTSRSSSRSRSHSSASSRSSSYSNSRSNSYSRSSASASSKSLSPPAPTTAVRKQPRKVHTLDFQDKLGQPFRTRDTGRRRLRHASPPVVSRPSRGGGSPRSDWLNQRGVSYDRIPPKSHGIGSDRHVRREPELRHRRSPPPPPPSAHRRPQRGDYRQQDEEAFIRSRHRRLSPHHFSSPPPPPPPLRHRSPPRRPPSPHRHPHRRPPSPHRRPVSPHRHPPSPHRRPLSPHRRPPSPHRHPPSPHRRPPSPHRRPPSPHRRPPSPHRRPPSPPRERLVISRHSPPPSSLHRPSRDQFNDHSHRTRTMYHSPPNRHHRHASLSPPPPPPPPASRARRDRRSMEGERRSHDVPREMSKANERQHSPQRRERRASKRIEENSMEALNDSRSRRSKAEKGSVSRSHKESKRSSKREPNVLSVLDSVSMSPVKQSNSQHQPSSPLNGVTAVMKSSPVNPILGDGDLLGEYDFNPFVDEELDYDENMEDIVADPAPPKAASIDGSNEDVSKEVENDVGGEEEEKELMEVSSASPSPSKEVVAVPPEDISSDSDDYVEEGMATIRSPIRVSPERGSRGSRERKGRRDKESSKSKTLSVKDRLFVSKKAIQEKRRSLGKKPVDSLRPSLANRLGPSPIDRHASLGTKRNQRGNLTRHPKGNAMEIALAYKKKKMEEESMLREEDKIKAKKVAKMINSQDSQSSSSKRMSPLSLSGSPESKADKEKALDQRITRIKQNNLERERREKEIEKDKRLYS